MDVIVKGEYPVILSKRFEEALIFAVQIHREQKRKGSDTPYVSHLLGAASIALKYGASEDEAIAALLHDAIEDQGGAKMGEQIRKRFGNSVRDIVNGCTDSDVNPKPPWRKRKEDYIAHLQDASSSVLFVSASDKLQNARSILEDYHVIGDDLWKRFTGKKDGTLWYYQSLVGAFRNAISSHEKPDQRIALIVDELERVVTEINHLVLENDKS